MSASLTTLRNALLERVSDELEALVLDPNTSLDAKDLSAVDTVIDALDALVIAASDSNPGWERKDLRAPMRAQADRIDHFAKMLRAVHGAPDMGASS